jgi:hypothetical protein
MVNMRLTVYSILKPGSKLKQNCENAAHLFEQETRPNCTNIADINSTELSTV